jgi:capsular polysaccharide biosynthesis protein
LNNLGAPNLPKEYRNMIILVAPQATTQIVGEPLESLLLALKEQFGDRVQIFEPKKDQSILEQRALFQKAKIIVGPNGPGLANLVWTGSGMKEH